jgi:hypothetical protein
MCFYFQSILKRRQLCDVTTQETVGPDFIIMAVRNPMSDTSENLWSRIGPRATSDQPLYARLQAYKTVLAEKCLKAIDNTSVYNLLSDLQSTEQ